MLGRAYSQPRTDDLRRPHLSVAASTPVLYPGHPHLPRGGAVPPHASPHTKPRSRSPCPAGPLPLLPCSPPAPRPSRPALLPPHAPHQPVAMPTWSSVEMVGDSPPCTAKMLLSITADRLRSTGGQGFGGSPLSQRASKHTPALHGVAECQGTSRGGVVRRCEPLHHQADACGDVRGCPCATPARAADHLVRRPGGWPPSYVASATDRAAAFLVPAPVTSCDGTAVLTRHVASTRVRYACVLAAASPPTPVALPALSLRPIREGPAALQQHPGSGLRACTQATLGAALTGPRNISAPTPTAHTGRDFAGPSRGPKG